MSKNTNKKAKGESTEEFDGVIASKVRFPLYVYPETMKTVDMIYKSDNCNTKTEFIEKAVRFYCGYLMQNKPELVSYLAPQICTITDGIIKGSEQRLARRYGCAGTRQPDAPRPRASGKATDRPSRMPVARTWRRRHQRRPPPFRQNPFCSVPC